MALWGSGVRVPSAPPLQAAGFLRSVAVFLGFQMRSPCRHHVGKMLAICARFGQRLATVPVYPATIHGRRRWVADLGRVNGRRVRRFLPTRRAAEAEIETADLQRRAAGDVWLGLTASERLDAAQVITAARGHGLTLREVWDRFVASNDAPAASVPLRVAIEETVLVKRAAGCRERYLDGLDSYLRTFARGREDLPVASITTADLDAWFVARRESPSARASNAGRLSAMFSVALRRGWIRENPTRRLEPVRLEQRPPVILSPPQSARLLVWVRRNRPTCLAHFVLGLMVGIRPEELRAMRWSSVNLDDGVVVVDAAASKVRRRRIVHLEPAALEWLTVARNRGAVLPVPPVTARRCLRALRGVLRLPAWPQDLLRHTAASYLVALRQDAGSVALELGNSPGVLLRVYRELVTRRDAARFWGLRPRRLMAAASPAGSTGPPRRSNRCKGEPTR